MSRIIERNTMSKNGGLGRQEGGAVLLEGLIALVIFSMGILALAGMQAAMVRNTTEANFRAEATYIAQKTVSAMWADPKNLEDYLTGEDGVDLEELPNGKLIVLRPSGDEQVRVTVTWMQEGDEQHKVVTNARMTGDVI